MTYDVIKNIKIMVGAIENILVEYIHLSDEEKKAVPPGIVDAIHDLALVIKWSKNE